MQQVYDMLEFDLQHYLSQEERMAAEIDELAQKLHQLPKDFSEDAIPLFPEPSAAILLDSEVRRMPSTYPRIQMAACENLDELVTAAEDSLQTQGIDLANDPLMQILNARQILEIAASYRRKYGDVDWEDADYAVVILAGVLGAILEFLLVKLPGHSELLLTLPQGYAMTTWLTIHVQRIQEEYSEILGEFIAHPSELPEAASENWLWSFITTLLDIVRRSGTFVDDHGNIVTAMRLSPETERKYTIDILQAVFRLLTNVFRAVESDDPFKNIRTSLDDTSLKDDASSLDDALSWERIAEYAQAHGYRPLWFLREGVIPAAIDLVVQGYWLLIHVTAQEKLAPTHLKITSMLALSHTLAISGLLIKSGLLFQFNPLTLNWSQMLRCLPLLLSWINEGIERESTIRSALDDEWRRLYQRITSSASSASRTHVET
jgi:hypothetical protein